jgi:hypothetical protein
LRALLLSTFRGKSLPVCLKEVIQGKKPIRRQLKFLAQPQPKASEKYDIDHLAKAFHFRDEWDIVPIACHQYSNIIIIIVGIAEEVLGQSNIDTLCLLFLSDLLEYFRMEAKLL